MDKNLQVSILLDFYGQLLTEKQLEALQYYYNEDLSLSEIGENLAISRQAAHDLIKKGENHLLRFEETLGLAKRFDRVKEKAEKIKKLAENISEGHDIIVLSEEILNEF